MKKFITILSVILCLATITSNAQVGGAYAFPLAAGDTLTNTDTAARSFLVSGGYQTMNIQVNLNKLSGTVAGKVYLYAASDARNYTLIDSSSYVAIPAGAGSSIFGAVGGYTHVARIKVSSPGDTKFLVAATSSGTVSAPVQFIYALKKHLNQ